MPKTKQRVSAVRLNPRDYDLIERAAQKEGRPVAAFLRFHSLKAAEQTLYFSAAVPVQKEDAVF